jgi:hypothetical protein
MLSALTLKLQLSTELLQPQSVSNALYGLQEMTSEAPEVRTLLSTLASKLQSCREEFNAQHVGNALYGLQGMSSDMPEVRHNLHHSFRSTSFQYISLTFSHPKINALNLSLPHSLLQPHRHTITLSHYHIITPPHPHTQSLCHTITPSHSTTLRYKRCGRCCLRWP